MPGFLVIVQPARILETAAQQQVRQLREELFEIDLVEVVAGELRVAVLHARLSLVVVFLLAPGQREVPLGDRRSEEHTSELQSHSDLVCRLLLEKKNKYIQSVYKRR